MKMVEVKKIDITLTLTAEEYVWFMAWMEHPKEYNYDEIREIARSISSQLTEM